MPNPGEALTGARRRASVYFSRPAIGCIAAGLKTLDLRMGHPLSVGHEYDGRERGSCVPLLVTSQHFFPSVPDMAQWALRNEMVSSLFPDAWLRYSASQSSSVDVPTASLLLTDIRSIVEFYSTCLGRRPVGPCVVYAISPLDKTPRCPRYLLGDVLATSRLLAPDRHGNSGPAASMHRRGGCDKQRQTRGGWKTGGAGRRRHAGGGRARDRERR